jgi:hypothetical protein
MRRIVFSIALFPIAATALFLFRLTKSRRTFYAQIECLCFPTAWTLSSHSLQATLRSAASVSPMAGCRGSAACPEDAAGRGQGEHDDGSREGATQAYPGANRPPPSIPLAAGARRRWSYGWRIAEKGKDGGMTGAAIGTRRFAAVRASFAVF